MWKTRLLGFQELLCIWKHYVCPKLHSQTTTMRMNLLVIFFFLASTAVCAIRSASRVSIANSKTLQNWKFQRYAASKNQSPPEQSQPQRHFDALASIQETSKVRLTQIPLTRLCDSASSLLLILLQHTDLLEGLHDLAVDTSTSIDVVRWTTASVAS